ncbi:MAG TPA: hypothetical protein VF599_24060 [Pyrinomonadaceae bacterium]|jgi:hypothetical protein
MLYLASDQEIPLTLWSKENANVCINLPVFTPKHFSKKHVYFVNSSECCGCGFRQEEDVSYPDFSEIESTNKNQAQLYKQLSDLLKCEDSVELFGCWAGSEEDLENRKEIRLSDFLNESFYFNENELLVVMKEEI